MKLTITSLAALALSAQHVTAFPGALTEKMIQIRSENEAKARSVGIDSGCPYAKREAEIDQVKDQIKRQAPGVTPPFNAQQQYVSNKGANKYVAPGSGDQRGPCPGLNAMANHGYLPHNGVGTIQNFIDGTQAAFGMGADLATFLAIYGAIFDGDLTSYSIGGPVPSLAGLGGLLGEPLGLSGSHNKYEGDVSPTRGDLYEYGNDYLVQLPQFTALYELGQSNGDSIDLNVLTEYRNTRFQQSVSQNPYFFNAPFSGVLAQPAAWSFVYRFMANKSAEHPMGLLNGAVLKSFYGVTGKYPNFKYTPGTEKIPDNWYKRNLVDYYTIPYLAQDALAMSNKYSEFLLIGGNTGKVNTVTGVNPSDLTGGVFTSSNLLQGNNLACFGFEASLQEAPDILSGLYTSTTAALSKLTSAVNAATSNLNCPKLTKWNDAQFSKYPGYTKLKSSGTY